MLAFADHVSPLESRLSSLIQTHGSIYVRYPPEGAGVVQASVKPEAAGEGGDKAQKGSRPAFRDPETIRQLELLQPGCCILSLRQAGLPGAGPPVFGYVPCAQELGV